MSDRPRIGIGAIRGATMGGRDLARTVAGGVSKAAEGVPPGRRVRIDALRVHTPEGADPGQVAAEVRRGLERALRGRTWP